MSDSIVPVDNLFLCFGHAISVLAVSFMAVYCSIPSVQDLWPESAGKKNGGLSGRGHHATGHAVALAESCVCLSCLEHR